MRGGAKRATTIGHILYDCKKNNKDVPIEVQEQLAGERELHTEALAFVQNLEKEHEEEGKGEDKDNGKDGGKGNDMGKEKRKGWKQNP